MKFVLDAPIGGLGDGLLYSTLPERFTRDGDGVWISPRTNCRNAEAFDLLYARNTYIKGVMPLEEADYVIGSPRAGADFVRQARFELSPIALVEDMHGIRPPYNHRPKIYYEPKPRLDVTSLILADPRSVSQGFPPQTFDAFVERLFIKQDQVRVIESPGAGWHGQRSLEDCARITVRDIYEYIDLIAACKAFLVTESGGQSLAAAVRDERIFVLCTTMSYNSRFFIYPGVHYTVTGSLSGDYLPNDLTGEGLF